MIRRFFCPVCRQVFNTARDGPLGRVPVDRHLETHGFWGRARGHYLLWWWYWTGRLVGPLMLRWQRRRAG